jgi:hypothetical protein
MRPDSRRVTDSPGGTVLSSPAEKGWSLVISITAIIVLIEITISIADEPSSREICRPTLVRIAHIELGKSGEFRWNCSGEESEVGFYIVFIRPSGTYVLLKVPRGRNSFEFAPDIAGTWRWLVIHTDPDRSKPDAESEPDTFSVTENRNRN